MSHWIWYTPFWREKFSLMAKAYGTLPVARLLALFPWIEVQVLPYPASLAPHQNSKHLPQRVLHPALFPHPASSRNSDQRSCHQWGFPNAHADWFWSNISTSTWWFLGVIDYLFPMLNSQVAEQASQQIFICHSSQPSRSVRHTKIGLISLVSFK